MEWWGAQASAFLRRGECFLYGFKFKIQGPRTFQISLQIVLTEEFGGIGLSWATGNSLGALYVHPNVDFTPWFSPGEGGGGGRHRPDATCSLSPGVMHLQVLAAMFWGTLICESVRALRPPFQHTHAGWQLISLWCIKKNPHYPCRVHHPPKCRAEPDRRGEPQERSLIESRLKPQPPDLHS